MKELEIAEAKFSELEDGEMKEVSAGETKVLLARISDECFAVGARCPHYGAPLVEGALVGERIVCPWHHACFDVRTGVLEEPPALDSLPRFDVRIDNDRIFVRLPGTASDRQTPKMAKRKAGDDRLFVILGGGAAGYMAAQTLREEDFSGRILMVTREGRLPYDRPNLSKDYLQGQADPEWMPLRSEDFFAEYDIEILREKEVVKVDPEAKMITFRDGDDLRYDSLLVATGGTPRRLPFQTGAQKNVFLLRSFSDTDAIAEAAEKGKRAVVIGASFIGMEAASSLKTRGCAVTVVAPDEAPFVKILGAEIGKLFQRIHEDNGVKFRLGRQVKGFAEEGGQVTGVVLEDGERLDADLVIVGVGVKPATDFLTGVELHPDGGVIADEFLRVAGDLYAAGDIAHFPDPRTGELTRSEHWRFAMQQGRVAARNMAGGREPFTAVPFFWTRQFDETLLYVGHAKEWDKIVFEGDPEKRDFLALYEKGGRVLAVAGMNRDREVAEWEERIRQNRVEVSTKPSRNSAAFLERSGSVFGLF